MVIVASLVALGAGNFPGRKPDEGNRVFIRSAWSHVLTKNYPLIAFRIFALDAIISLYGHDRHVAHLAALEAPASQFLDAIKPIDRPIFAVADGFSEIRATDWKAGASAHIPDVPPQTADCADVARTVRECVRVLETGKHAN